MGSEPHVGRGARGVEYVVTRLRSLGELRRVGSTIAHSAKVEVAPLRWAHYIEWVRLLGFSSYNNSQLE